MSSRIRISGGRLGGRRISAPPEIRPTSGRVRESLLSIWTPRLSGARVLDLFAGSGAVGIEAVSRGAASACLVEKHAAALEQLAENCLLLDAGECLVIAMNLPDDLSSRPTLLPGQFDLIFADPPYRFDAFDGLAAGVLPFLDLGGEFVIEHSTRFDLPAVMGGIERYDQRRYGNSSLSFFRLARSTTQG